APVAERLRERWAIQPSIPSLRKTIIALLLAVICGLWSAPGQWLISGQPTSLERGVDQGTVWQLAALLKAPADVQEKALAQLGAGGLEASLKGNILTTETLGDYLVWAQLPDNRIFIYSHVHLFPPEHWNTFAAVK